MLLLLAALTAFGPMSLDLYLPGFPAIAATYGTDTGSVQLTMSACLVGLGLGQVLWGPVSDRYGRRRPLLAGLLVFVVASLAITVAPSIPVLVALRFVQALGGSAGIVVARAIVRDLYEGKALARTMSAIVTVFAVAPVVAPVIGSALTAVGDWQWMFVFLAAFAGACLVLSLRLPETLPADRRTRHGFAGALRTYRAILGERRFRYSAAVAALGSVALFSYISSSPAVVMDEYGVGAVGFAMIFAGLAACFAIGAQVNIRALTRHRVVTLLRVSVAAQLVASTCLLAVALLTAPLVVLLVPLAVAMLTVAGVNSNGLALALDPFPRAAASAAALAGGLQQVMGALVAALLSAAVLPAAVEMGIGMTLAGGLSIAIVGLSVRRRAYAAAPAR